ncbi:hypothetical protein SUGI_0082070, partial [Cryptomeria japonica]
MIKGELKSEIVSLLDGDPFEGLDAGDGVKRAGKKYFLPGESFKSWSNYGKALYQTPRRFKDRALSRADEMKEVGEIRKRSGNDMKRTLNWWDLIWFGFGGGFSVMLSVFCFTEFAVEIPVAAKKVLVREQYEGDGAIVKHSIGRFQDSDIHAR